MSNTPHDDPFQAMDRMYRVQRYFYDATRKYYLLGRDELLDRIDPQPGERILEIGCGTGRNLIKLARKCPEARLFGLDASAAMLETAAANFRRAGIFDPRLETALADEFSAKRTFGFNGHFDKVFFSYSISMITAWEGSISNALRELRPGGSLYLVDFYDQSGLPFPAGVILQKWLALFGVHYPSGLFAFLQEMEQKGEGELSFAPLYRGYSFIAEFRKS